MIAFHKILFSCLLSLFILSPAGYAEAYDIRFNLPAAVGDEVRLVQHLDYYEYAKTSKGDKSIQVEKHDYSLEFEARTTVLEVDKKQRASKLALKVIKLDKLQEGVRIKLASGGTIITTFVKEGEDVFEIDGRPVTEELDEALALLVSLPKTDVTDDDIFGPRERKNVGDAWAINSPVAVRDLVDQGFKVKEKDVTGTVEIKGIAEIDNARYLELASTVLINKFAPPGFPDDFKVKQSTLESAFSGLFPVEPGKDVKEESQTLNMSMLAEYHPGPKAPKVVFQFELRQHSETEYLYPEKDENQISEDSP